MAVTSNRSLSYWKSCLIDDVAIATTGSRVRRWSLQSLANLTKDIDSQALVSRTLLEDTAYRLARQHEYITKVLDVIDNDVHLHPIYHKRFDALQYVQFDTYKLCKQMLLDDRETFWNRFTKSDHYVINAIMEQVRSRHANTIEPIADLVTSVRQTQEENLVVNSDCNSNIHNITDTFLHGRLGVQLLCDHHVKLYRHLNQKVAVGDDNGCYHVSTGAVSVNASIRDVIMDAVTEAQHMCDAHLQKFPEATIHEDNNDDVTRTTDIMFIRPWVHHALVEVSKNAMASSVQKNNNIPPPIRIIVKETDSILSIDLIDQGLGFVNNDIDNDGSNESDLDHIIEDAFLLGHSSTNCKKWDRLNEQQSYAAVRSPLSSLGVGLHSSRCMMEHFGGSLRVVRNRSGGGCTAHVEIGKDATVLERIPGSRPNN